MTPLSPLTTRIPSWQNDGLEPRNCPLCSASGHPSLVRPDNLVVNECEVCGTFFISPAPSEKQLTDFYATYFSGYRKANPLSSNTVIKETLLIEPFADFRNKVLSTLLGTLQGKAALDVGFGRGHNLVALKKLGAKVSGIDLDNDAITLAKDKLGISDVCKCSVEDFVPQHGFDLVTMYDFIEHPLFPLRAFAKAAELLSPGGLLAIYTPNATFAKQDKEPVCFRTDLEHMQYLTIQSCRHLANAARMQIAHIENVGFPRLEKLASGSTVSVRKRSFASGGSTVVKNIFRELPVFKFLNGIRKSMWAIPPDIRQGRYCLFCVFRKA